MIYLVYGGSGSGKSAFAENIVMSLNLKEKYYLATMKIYDKEGLEKVQRHKILRAGKGFKTLEKETLDDMEEIRNAVSKKKSVILLECLSNLVANEMFKNMNMSINEDMEKKILSCETVVKKVCKNILELQEISENVVYVSNNIFDDGIDYDENTREYMQALGKINAFLAEKADKVFEVVCGIPLEVK